MVKIVRALVLTFAVAGVAHPVFAGPPLLCHPFHTGAAGEALLPWAGTAGWNSPDPRYDVKNLVADTTRLLTPHAPVLVRMENIRRAAIYASRDNRLMTDLLKALNSRAQPRPRRTRWPSSTPATSIETSARGRTCTASTCRPWTAMPWSGAPSR